MFSPIAIVGRACVLPGALTPDDLWRNVAEGRNLVGPPPDGYWGLNADRISAPGVTGPETACSRMGGYVDGFDAVFDPEGFARPADRIRTLDPLFQWLLHCGREALREAGVSTRDGDLTRAGAILGNLSYPPRGHADFAEGVWLADVLDRERIGNPENRFSSGYPAHVLAEALGLGGEALMLDAACASSLYAIKLACDRLHDGDADLMLAGAVNRADDLFLHVGFTSLQALSPSGRSRPFDRAADGLLPAEGAALVALKRLDDAVRDGDRVFGVIRGVGLSNDGRQRGFLAPDGQGQVRAMRAAYAQSGLDPADIGYVECHATGTPVGDGVEIAAMAEVFGADAGLPVGSLKSNLGHLITASGAAGLLKVLGMMEHGQVPPTLNLESPIAAFDGAGFRPQRETAPWPDVKDAPRRAAVNSFGFGGNNAHLLVEAFDPDRAAEATLAKRVAPTPVAICALGVVAGNCRGLTAFADAIATPGGPPARTAVDGVELPLSGLRFPPKDLQRSLPQQPLMIEAALEAVGQMTSLPAERTGVLIGMGCDAEIARYGLRWRLADILDDVGVEVPADWLAAARDDLMPALDAAAVVGTMPNIPANRLNAQFDCTAFGFTLSSEELSGLAALKTAARALAAGEIDAALVGAVDLSVEPVHMAAAEALFPADRKRPGDAAVAVVLKRLDDAERDGERILAEIGDEGAGEEGAEELCLDPAAGESPVTHRFGHAHAASGLLHLAWAMVAPGSDGAGRRVSVTSFSGREMSVDLEVRPGAVASVPEARDPGKSLNLPAHFPPVRLGPPPAEGMPGPQPAIGQVMAPAPSLPPVADLAPVVPLEPAVAAPPAAPVPTGGGSEGAARLLAQAAEVHREHLERQARLYQDYVALQEAAWLRFRGGEASVAVAVPAPVPVAPEPPMPPAPPVEVKQPAPPVPAAVRTPEAAPDRPAPSGPAFDRADLERLASGRIADVFGAEFEQQAGYLRQVRMPTPPMLLADRVTGITGAPGSMTKGTIWTETDVDADAWYLHQGHMPPGIVIESGQADLLLISWLGADFLNKGERVYRLLGCELTFHEGGLPKPGDTLAYDIHVDGHAKTGDVRLFFFHYDCHIGDRRLLSVREGQAGFFTDAELDGSGGVLWSPEDDTPDPAARLDPPPNPTAKRAFSGGELADFAAGNAYACFGEGFERAAAHQRTPTIPTGRMALIDSVAEFDPKGGPWGRGYLRAEAHVPPDAWFYGGHFLNDPCMPGTLMADAAVQSLSVAMAAMGFTVDRDGWRFEPVPEEPFQFVCRGQVVPDRPHDLTYEIFIEEIIDEAGRPRVYAALLCSSDGFKVFQCRRFGLQLTPDWPLGTRPGAIPADLTPHLVAEGSDVRGDYAALLACAWGAPSAAFGAMYERFDHGRTVPRLPGPPYHFMSRVVACDCPAGEATEGGGLAAEYDVPPDAWYFRDNGAAAMPISVLMEVMLQPCGWLASYMGFALTDGDLAFRNLDGDWAVPTATVGPDAGTLTVRTRLTRYSRVGEMTIVFFRVDCDGAEGPVYSFDTSFGFFSPGALANQVGLPATDGDRARLSAPSDTHIDLRDEPADLFHTQPRLASRRLRMLDEITGFWPTGGDAGLGRIRGRQEIDAEAWYFKAHFYQDPVQAGSLGIEALVQLLRAFARLSGLGSAIAHSRFEPVALNEALVWKYRGQVVPTNREVVTELEVTAVETETDGSVKVAAKGSLWVDGLRIYEVENLALRIVSAAPGARFVDVAVSEAAMPWLADHCPTYTLPALPMMAEVHMVLDAARAARPSEVVTGIKDFRLSRWVTGETDLRIHMDDAADGVSVRVTDGPAPVATGQVTLAAAYAAAPLPLDLPGGLPSVDDPYAGGALFHGPAFHVIDGLRRDERGAVHGLANGPDLTVVLDGALHGIPHDDPALWAGDDAEGQVAYPANLRRLEFFGPRPAAETLEVRAHPIHGDGKSLRVEVQILAAGAVWCAFELDEVLLPKGPLGKLSGAGRRAFLRDRAVVPGARLSDKKGDETHLTEAAVLASNWLPGTLEAVYGASGTAAEMTRAIAIKEHVAARAGVHPEAVTVEGDAATCAVLPGTRFPVTVMVEAGAVSVKDEEPPVFDPTPFRDYWRRRLGFRDWPVEDIYFALVRRFVRSVRLEDPSAMAGLRGRPALFLANHQVGIESLTFAVIAAALGQRPVVTIAKGEHRETWLGRLIAHCRAHPGARLPRALMFFDRDDQASMLTMMAEMQSALGDEGLSLMVHAEGTRSLHCGAPVTKVSGVILDLAVKARLPIVPVRFAGGLPREPLADRLEFPLGHGAQDIYLGTPVDPAELADLPLGPRRDRVLAALNGLGPEASEETPNPGDADFAAGVERLVSDLGLPAARASVLLALERDPETGDRVKGVIEALRRGDALADGLPDRDWLAGLADWFRAKGED